MLIPADLKLEPFELDQLKVQELTDDGIGSFIFLTNNQNRQCLKKYIVNVYCLDTNNTPIHIGINVNADNQLYELDSWKVNGEPLLSPLGTILKLFDQEWKEIFSDL